MRRGLLVAATLLVALGTATALGAFTPGRYTGSSAQGAVRFTATKTAITSFTAAVHLRCSNGATARNTTTINRMPIRGGRFSSAGGPAAVSGTLTGSRASGTVSVTLAQLPNGRNCTSGRVAWSARRQKAGGGGLTCTPVADFNGTDLQVDFSCGGAEFDAFDVRLPRAATRADTSTAHLRCLAGRFSDARGTTDGVNCSAQDGVKLKSGRVVIRFATSATCDDLRRSSAEALVVGDATYGPFPLTSTVC